MESEQNGDDNNIFRAAFGEHTDKSSHCRGQMNQLKCNDPDRKKFAMYPHDAENFSDLAWELLGGYINGNDHLTAI